MKAIKLAAFTVAALASGVAMANTTASTIANSGKTAFSALTNPAAVSVELGSLGYGANVGWAVNENTELQIGWAGGNVTDLVDGDFQVSGVTYDLKTKLSNPYIGVQMRPAANWFTVGAGIIVPDNKITATAQRGQDETITVNGEEYNIYNATITAELEHKNKLAPYLTVGFRPNLNNNWGVFGEIGAAYMGETEATVRVVNGTVTQNSTAIASNSTFEEDAKADIENEDWYEWYPIVKLGVTYRF